MRLVCECCRPHEELEPQRPRVPRIASDLPLFLCEVVGDQWRFWCPFCREHHVHGAGAGRRAEHRIAHCHRPSPLRDGGYFIKPAGGTVPSPSRSRSGRLSSCRDGS